ncbi:MAG: recombinase family protein [Hyphomonas sp.]|nr:recombinase family protein [Hyphomonas sp.]
MKQCFGYLRVSTTKQGDGVSLDAQKAFITDYATRNQITITQWFEEKETAAKQGRPAFNAMVAAINRGKAVGFIAHKIDRSARNFADWAKIGDLSDAGYEVHFAAETLDFRSRGGRLSADMQAVIATDYIRNLREEVRKGIDGRLKQGLYPFKAPCGYLDNGRGKPKTLDPERAPLVKELFDLYASGNHSIRSLRSEMIRRGLTSRTGRPPSKRQIEAILANPFYCGIIHIKRTGATYEGIHEPLISVALFDRVQAVKSGKAGKKVTRHNHMFRGLFRCASCRRSMIPERQKGRVYYRCQVRSCPTTTMREDMIEDRIIDALLGLRLSGAAIDRLTDQVTRWVEERHDCQNDELTLTRNLAAVEQRLENLTDALIDKHIDHDTYAAKRQSLLLEKRRIEDQAEAMAELQAAPGQVRRFLELAKTLAAYYQSLEPAERRQFVQTAFSNRRVEAKSVAFEPSDWLAPVRSVSCAPVGEPFRPTSRSGPDLKPCQIEALVMAAYSDQVQSFLVGTDTSRLR